MNELIYYERPDLEGPKLSNYSKCSVPHGADLLNVLTQALGVRGVVKKTRHLYIHQQTRIHIDDVEGLGKFVELEVPILKIFCLVHVNFKRIFQFCKCQVDLNTIQYAILKKFHSNYF